MNDDKKTKAEIIQEREYWRAAATRSKREDTKLVELVAVKQIDIEQLEKAKQRLKEQLHATLCQVARLEGYIDHMNDERDHSDATQPVTVPKSMLKEAGYPLTRHGTGEQFYAEKGKHFTAE